MIAPNNSFKPNLLRYSNGVAEKACHAVASTTQVGLTQALAVMSIIFAIATSLLVVPPAAGKPEAECIKQYPGDWAKITECVAPSIDMSKNPKLRDFFAACDAVRNAAQSKGASAKSATLVVHGVEQTCEFK
jgi:hypothetical protein